MKPAKLLTAAALLSTLSILTFSTSAQNTPAPAASAGPCMARYTGPGKNPPARWDDIFWENDKIAHRIYGPAVSRPAPDGEGLVSSGIDVWVKNVRTPFMDKQLMSGKQHDFHGEGQDCYDTGKTRGCGGLGIWDDASKKLINSRNWAECYILKNGPDVASFRVHYDNWDIGNGRIVDETRTFSLPAGSNLTRLVSTINSNKPEDILVGIGITKRRNGVKNQANGVYEGEGSWIQDKEKGLMIYWEPEQKPNGTTGIAVVVDPASIVKFVNDSPDENLVIVKVTPGKPWVYYTGACWSKGLDFHTDKEWETYVRGFKAEFDATK